jgi:uncharacterized protein with NAD-binding domain and iron-sulfur cluster
MRVCVLGAGIGGLSAAHELNKLGHEVTVYERNPEVGGLARSRFEPDGSLGEYCWHAFGAGYGNLLSLLGEIPSGQGGTVADRLRPVGQWVYGCEGERAVFENASCFLTKASPTAFARFLGKLGTRLTWRDVYRLGLLFLFLQTTDPRRLEPYDDVLWSDFVAPLSPGVRRWVTDPASIILGMDIERLSAHTMLEILSPAALDDFQREWHEGELVRFSCLDGPMHQMWLEPWRAHLESRGVCFHLETPVQRVRCEGGRVVGVEVEGPAGVETVAADHYVNALSVEAIARVLDGAPERRRQLQELSELSRQTQVQVLYRLHDKLEHETPTILYFVDSPWQISTRFERSFARDHDGAPGADEELLAAGIGIWHRPGVVYGKPARACTREELVEEVWQQMRRAPGLLRSFRTRDGRGLEALGYASAGIWHSYGYDPAHGAFCSWEPKFSNNVGTLALRPQVTDGRLENLVHAVAYARTRANIYNMESAAEAGVRAARAIHEGRPGARFERRRGGGWIRQLLRRLDGALCRSGRRNPFERLLTGHLRVGTRPLGAPPPLPAREASRSEAVAAP